MLRILPSTQASRLLKRRAARLTEAEETVRPILAAVRDRGDKALVEFAQKFDGLDRKSVRVPERELAAAKAALPRELRSAVRIASKNIRAFAETQLPPQKLAEI
jgi:histidinol dehydrogenase